MTEVLIVIDGGRFYGGLVARDGKVIEAAHVLKYMKGWDGKKVAGYCAEKGWSWERVSTTTS